MSSFTVSIGCCRKRKQLFIHEGEFLLRILLIDDTSEMADVPVNVYENQGFHVDYFRHPGHGDVALRCISYGAVVYMTETRDVTVLKRWRKSGLIAPVIVISRFSAVSVRVAFLNAGADDWLPLPAAAEEVIARLRAILRRNYSLSDVVLRYGELVFDPTIRIVTYQGLEVKLTAKEMTILELFLLNHTRLLTRRYLEDQLSTWQRDVNSNIIEVHISNLRRKLGGNIIQTVRGQGYRLREP